MPDNNENYILRENDFDLKKILYVIFVKRWVLISVIAIVMLFDLIYTYMQTPIYRPEALVLIDIPKNSTLFSNRKEVVLPELSHASYYNTQNEILKSKMLSRRVVKALDLGSLQDFKGESPEKNLQEKIRVEAAKDTRLIKVGVEYKDPIMATKMTNTLVSLYIKQNIENMLFMSKEILRAFPQDAKKIERSTIYGQLKDLSEEEAAESLPSVVDNQILQRLKTEKIVAETELANLSKRYKEKHPSIIALNTKLKFINSEISAETNKILSSIRADLAGRLQANNIRVIDYADVPKKPFKPAKLKNILAGLFFSIFLGVTLIFFMEYLDDSIKNEETIKSGLNLPYLGTLPFFREHFSALPKGRESHISLEEMDKNPDIADAIRNIRTNILFSAPRGELKKILFTSVLPKEGKTLVSSYMALSFAKNGIKTLIIDADIRKPRIHNVFSIQQKPGLVNLLVEPLLPDTIVKETSHENLYVIPSGSKTPNPAELLGSDKMGKLIEELSGKFEMIIIDTPPSFSIPDALILSKFANATIFVTKYGMVSKNVLDRIKGRFNTAGSKISGVIINFSDIKKSGYYDYKYYHKYYKKYYTSSSDFTREAITKELV